MKQFVSVNDVENIDELVKLAQNIKAKPFDYKQFGENKTIGLFFFNPSLRTRLSTQKAAQNLGMNVMVVNLNNDGWVIELEDGAIMNQGSQEHIKEAAVVISQYCDIIGIRTFPALQNREEDYSEKILKQFLKYCTVPVISLESATLHPLQSLADLLTIEENKNTAKPKVVLSWAPHPKALPQAVSNSFLQWLKNYDCDLSITNPEGFDLAEEFTEGLTTHHNQDEALKDADFVYVKNWSSYQDYGKIGTGFDDWTITQEKLKNTNNAKVMHCLPVRRNVVIADDVLDSDSSLTTEQANNRTFAAQSVLLKILQNEA